MSLLKKDSQVCVRLIAILAGLLTACDPEVKFAGTVSAASGVGLGGVTIHLDCDNRSFALNEPIVSRPDGAFAVTGLGCVPRSCMIRATHKGITTRKTVADSCARYHWYCKEDNCNEIKVNLLFPE
jgi:hypothetical protein